MYAILIAGGRGERLRPLTETRPKPMVEVAGRPIMAYQVDWLIAQGVRHFVISCGYLHEVIQAHFGDGSALGAQFEYAVEDTPLGRGGGLKQGLRLVPRDEPRVIATNADILTDQPLQPMIDQHEADGNMATILLTRYRSQFGIVEHEDGKVTSFTSNPLLPHWINGGVYVLSQEFKDRLPDIGDHESSTFPELANDRLLGAFLSDGWWRAMDSLKDHATLEQEVAERPPAASNAT